MKAILRAEKLKSMGNVAGSLSHTYRTRETHNAAPERMAANTLQGSPEAVMQALKDRLPEKHRKDAVIAVEYFIGASPEWFTGRSRAEQDKYFADARQWLQERHGADNVLDFSIHRDETSPHAVAYVVPLVDGKLNAKKFLGGRQVMSQMQTDFAQQVGRPHQLERGIEGSKARHVAIKEFYEGVGRDQPEKLVVDLPEPSFSERLKPAAYGQRVAEVVMRQVDPALKAAKAQGVQLKATQKQLRQVNAAAAAATKAAQAERARADYFQGVAELFTPQEIEDARARRAEQERKKAVELERKRRIDALPRLHRKEAGAALTFVSHALDAIERAGGDSTKVDWAKVEGAAIREAISQHGQSPESVTLAICELSPVRVGGAGHAKVAAWVQEKAPALQQQYEAQQHGHGGSLQLR